MKYYTLLLLLVIPIICLGQSKLTVEGSIIDAENDEAIPYAHIGIPAEHVGTASTRDGTFVLELHQKYRDDTLQVSAIGYQSKKIALSSVLDANSPIKLQSKTYQMKTVTVSGRQPETKWIGKKIRPVLSASYGRNIGHEKIGAAYAFRVKWDGPLPMKILYARMFLKENKNDELTMRCRIVDSDTTNNLPGDDIAEESIITTSESEKGWITCDFKKHDIYVNQRNFFLVFEWLPKEGQVYTPMFAIGLFFDSEVYKRAHAMGKWSKNPNDIIYGLKIKY